MHLTGGHFKEDPLSSTYFLKAEFRYGIAIIDANLYDSKLMLIIP